MNTNFRPVPWTDPLFLENQREFPLGELLRHVGRHIAWSWDGAQIIASDVDRRALDEKLRAAGIDPLQVIHDFVEDPDSSRLA